MQDEKSWSPVAVVALGDPRHRDEGLPMRAMGRVRTLIGEIGCSRSPQESRGSSTSSSASVRELAPISEAGATVASSAASKVRSGSDSTEESGSSFVGDGVTDGSLALDLSIGGGALVQWIEGGNESVRLEPLLVSRRRVVLIDSVQLGGRPGTVYHWHMAPANNGLTLLRHYGRSGNMKLDHLAFWLEDDLPCNGIDLIGVEPNDTTEGSGLSRPIRSRFPTICAQVTALMFRILIEEGW